MTAKRILVIDDEFQITRVLKRSLAAHRYDVRTASDGESGLDLFRDFHPDLVITDLSMPEMTGIEVCREIRRASSVPVIILSVRGEERTKVEALDAGADDYITKPFGMDELLARVRVALRRGADSDTKPVSDVGDFRLDLPNHMIYVRGEEVHLTPKEFAVLAELAKHPGQVLSHAHLLRAAWGPAQEKQSDYLRVAVRALRQKLERDPAHPSIIINEPAVGYRLRAGYEAEQQ